MTSEEIGLVNPMATKKRFLTHRLLGSLIAVLLWPLFVDALDLVVKGSWTYDFLVNEVSGLALGCTVWIALGQYDKRQAVLEERYQMIRTLAHHISNPVQILMNRNHLPGDHKEKLVNGAVDELSRVCREIIPRL